MAPRVTTFTRDTVLRAALDIVRCQGWEALTARNVAARLGASVAPVYSAFGSMENLMRATIEDIRRLLDDSMAKAYTEIPFLNIGVGIVSFAREEPLLYQAFFQARHGFKDIIASFDASLLSWMKTDAQLGLLNEVSRQRLYDNIGCYTVGLASIAAAGRVAEFTSDDIIRLLKNVGNIMMFAEISGIADCASPENKHAWMLIMKERKMPVHSSLPRQRAKGASIKRRKKP